MAEFIAHRVRRRGRNLDLVDSATPEASQVQPI